MKSRIVVSIAFLMLASSASARFMRPDLEKVPVERLVKNLDELAAKEPKNVQVRYNLARVHAMAFALKTDTCEVNKKQETAGAWFGFTPGTVPFKSIETNDKEKQELAKKHLQKAIAIYAEVLKLQPDHPAAQLGLAWCVEQSGDKAEAVKDYRKVIEAGWDKESKLKFGSMGGLSLESIKTTKELDARIAQLALIQDHVKKSQNALGACEKELERRLTAGGVRESIISEVMRGFKSASEIRAKQTELNVSNAEYCTAAKTMLGVLKTQWGKWKFDESGIVYDRRFPEAAAESLSAANDRVIEISLEQDKMTSELLKLLSKGTKQATAERP